jgi:predicted Zn-dependent peptidase
MLFGNVKRGRAGPRMSELVKRIVKNLIVPGSTELDKPEQYFSLTLRVSHQAFESVTSLLSSLFADKVQSRSLQKLIKSV